MCIFAISCQVLNLPGVFKAVCLRYDPIYFHHRGNYCQAKIKGILAI